MFPRCSHTTRPLAPHFYAEGLVESSPPESEEESDSSVESGSASSSSSSSSSSADDRSELVADEAGDGALAAWLGCAMNLRQRMAAVSLCSQLTPGPLAGAPHRTSSGVEAPGRFCHWPTMIHPDLSAVSSTCAKLTATHPQVSRERCEATLAYLLAPTELLRPSPAGIVRWLRLRLRLRLRSLIRGRGFDQQQLAILQSVSPALSEKKELPAGRPAEHLFSIGRGETDRPRSSPKGRCTARTIPVRRSCATISAPRSAASILARARFEDRLGAAAHPAAALARPHSLSPTGRASSCP